MKISQVSCFERVWESVTNADSTTLSALTDAFNLLKADKNFAEDISIKVIVDPTLHSLVYDHTLVSLHPSLRTHPPPPLTDIYTLSQKYALLPADVFVSSTGDAKFLSYINDVNPQLHESIYQSIECALTSFIPLFEHTLTDLHRNNPLPQRIQGTCRYTVWDEPDPPEHSDDEEGWVNYEREMRQWSLNRPISLPDVPLSGYPGGIERRKHSVSLNSKRIQCIVNVSEYQTVRSL